MGGYNSGRWHAVETRTMVEDCLEVSIRNFRRCKKFEARRKIGFADSCRDMSEPLIVSEIWKWGSNSVAFRGEMGADGPQDLHLIGGQVRSATPKHEPHGSRPWLAIRI